MEKNNKKPAEKPISLYGKRKKVPFKDVLRALLETPPPPKEKKKKPAN